MGLFDWVVGVPEMNCDCGERLVGWQTKDANCHLIKIHFTWVHNFYTSCVKCKKWWEFYRDGYFEDKDWTVPKEGISFENFNRKE